MLLDGFLHLVDFLGLLAVEDVRRALQFRRHRRMFGLVFLSDRVSGLTAKLLDEKRW